MCLFESYYHIKQVCEGVTWENQSRAIHTPKCGQIQHMLIAPRPQWPPWSRQYDCYPFIEVTKSEGTNPRAASSRATHAYVTRP